MTEKDEKMLFDTEQQVRKDKVLAAAATYLSGRSGCKQGKRHNRQRTLPTKDKLNRIDY